MTILSYFFNGNLWILTELQLIGYQLNRTSNMLVMVWKMALWHQAIIWTNTELALIARSMGPTWGRTGDDRTQMGPMLALWTLLSGSSVLVHMMAWSHKVHCYQDCSLTYIWDCSIASSQSSWCATQRQWSWEDVGMGLNIWATRSRRFDYELLGQGDLILVCNLRADQCLW